MTDASERPPSGLSREFEYEGHIVQDLRRQEPSTVSYGPRNDGNQFWADLPPDQMAQATQYYARMVDNRDETGLMPPLPQDPVPVRGRAPVYVEPLGFAEANGAGVGGADPMAPLQVGDRHEEVSVSAGGYLTNQQFENFAQNFKGADGRYVVMSAYGAVPVPDNVMQDVPEEFVAAPKYEEFETFVLKKKHHDRITDKAFTQHEHHFVEVVKKGQVEKLVPAGEEKKITIPKYFYKAIIAENVIEVPQGTKYTETPIDVHMRHPPKLVPQRKAIIVNRDIECTKPVVQEKIIEKPKIVKRSVPRVVTKEIPFVVPKYVEKIIEVPYRPGMVLPPASGDMATNIPECPSGVFGPVHPPQPGSPAQASYFSGGSPVGSPMPAGTPQPGPSATPGFTDVPPGARIEGSTLYMPADADPNRPQTVYLPPGVKEIKVPFEAKIDVSVVQAEEHGAVARPVGEGGLPGFVYHPGFPMPGSEAHAAFMEPTAGTKRFQDVENQGEGQHQRMTHHNGGGQHHRGTQSSQGQSSYQLDGSHRHSRSNKASNRTSDRQSGYTGDNSHQLDGSSAAYGDPRSFYTDHPGRQPSSQSWNCCGVHMPEVVMGSEIPMPPPARPMNPNAAYVAAMDPVVIHDMPGMKNVKYHKQGREPQVLTQHGVTGLSRVSSSGVPCYHVPSDSLYPPLPPAPAVPLQNGQLNMRELERIQNDFRSKLNPSIAEAMQKQQEEEQ